VKEKKRASSKFSEKTRPQKRKYVLEEMAQFVVNKQRVCFAAGYKGYQCSNRFEGCHIIPRGEDCIAPNPLNLVCMCNIHHRYFTQHELEWQEYVESQCEGRRDNLKEIVRLHKSTRQKVDWDYWYSYWKPFVDEIKEEMKWK